MHLLLLASVTDKVVEPIVDVATEFIGSAGVVAVFLLMTLESACIPIPSEAIMLFAGFSVSNGELTLFGIVAAGVLGNLAGSWIAYAVGYYGRLDLLEKNKLIHISPKHLKWADDWFERYGTATVFFSRMLPIIRTFISLPAGVAKMPFWRFTAFTLLGSIPWVLALAIVGEKVGDNWEDWRHKLGYLDYLVAVAIVVGVVYLIVKRRRGGGPGAGGDASEAATRPARAGTGGA
ncbi:MAG TPA: DedA family protein [Solirubrobacterales bacterium]|jgi:membrane protein DedA with SNARE-associated domain|nr:DedA family protein [Solirubrobacterales bacterium]